MQGVPPLDVPELLAYLVRQSSPFLDQIGIRRGESVKWLLYQNKKKRVCQMVVASINLLMQPGIVFLWFVILAVFPLHLVSKIATIILIYDICEIHLDVVLILK